MWGWSTSHQIGRVWQWILKFICLPTGSRIASWLPSFSVEVMHTTNILGIAQANNSQLMAMVSSCFQFHEVADSFLILNLHEGNAAIILSLWPLVIRPIRSRRCSLRCPPTWWCRTCNWPALWRSPLTTSWRDASRCLSQRRSVSWS